MPNLFKLNRAFWEARGKFERLKAAGAGIQDLLDAFGIAAEAYRAYQRAKDVYKQARRDAAFSFTDSIDVPR